MEAGAALEILGPMEAYTASPTQINPIMLYFLGPLTQGACNRQTLSAVIFVIHYFRSYLSVSSSHFQTVTEEDAFVF